MDGNKKYYVGSTENINQRMHQHGNGHTQTTRNMLHPEIVFKQEFESIGIARKIERKIKALKRKDYIEKIITAGYIKMIA